MRDVIAIVLCCVGLFFALSGAVGMLRMPDLYTRLQCATKTVTMGLLPALLGLAFAKGFISQYGGRALFVAVLVLLTNPAAAHAVARGAYKAGVPMWGGSVRDEPRDEIVRDEPRDEIVRDQP